MFSTFHVTLSLSTRKNTVAASIAAVTSQNEIPVRSLTSRSFEPASPANTGRTSNHHR